MNSNIFLLHSYDERIERIETRITLLLRKQLASAKNAREMFRIFGRFNALFVRPHIGGAIREYQSQLVQSVKQDLDNLQKEYLHSQAMQLSAPSHVLACAHDIPPVSAAIIWARQIERQLFAYMRRVEDVLGTGWEKHREGQDLKELSDNFKAMLNTQEMFEEWCKRVQTKVQSSMPSIVLGALNY